MMQFLNIILAFLVFYKTASAQTTGAEAVHKIALSITKDCKDDYQKIKVVYDWITANISYDDERANLINITSLSPDSILNRKRGICSDYANLAKAMFEGVKIKCKVIEGTAKQNDEDIVDFDVTAAVNRHAWNAVYLNNKWQLLDCTWGSLVKVVDHTNARFFLLAPEKFIFTHYPDDQQWTLLNRNIAIEEFINYPIVKAYFNYTDQIPPLTGVLSTDNDSLLVHNLGLFNIKDSLRFLIVDVNQENRTIDAVVQPIIGPALNFALKIKGLKKGRYFLQVFKDEKDDYFVISKPLITFLINKN